MIRNPVILGVFLLASWVAWSLLAPTESDLTDAPKSGILSPGDPPLEMSLPQSPHPGGTPFNDSGSDATATAPPKKEGVEDAREIDESELEHATTFKDLSLKEQEYTAHQAVARARLASNALINGVEARENDGVTFDHETGAVSELHLKEKVLLDADHPALGDDAWIVGAVLFFPDGEIYQLRVAEGQPLFGHPVPARTSLNFDRDGSLAEIIPSRDFNYRGRALKSGVVYRIDSAGNIADR